MDANHRIFDPGIYDMPDTIYHADPCETPSLSAGMISDLLLAPAKCLENSPRLNPHYEDEGGEEKFTIGSVSHVLFLEPHLFSKKVQVVHFDDWRKNEAKDARKAAKAAGRIAILAKNMETVEAARAAFYRNQFTAKAFEDGVFERSMFWRHPVHGFWCRARPDFLANSGRHLNDYKATASADPSEFGRHAYKMGYHRRAAWYLEGAEILLGRRPDHYWFCNQETKAPYLTSVIELDREAIEAGQVENDRAAAIFARCLQTSDWYGYRHPSDPEHDRAFQVGLPAYALMSIDGRI